MAKRTKEEHLAAVPKIVKIAGQEIAVKPLSWRNFLRLILAYPGLVEGWKRMAGKELSDPEAREEVFSFVFSQATEFLQFAVPGLSTEALEEATLDEILDLVEAWVDVNFTSLMRLPRLFEKLTGNRFAAQMFPSSSSASPPLTAGAPESAVN